MKRLPLTRILLRPDGSFTAAATGEVIQFKLANEIPVGLLNLPEGAWPFAYERNEQGASVYFSYFLSSSVHRWRMDSYGVQRSVGDMDPDEIASMMRGWLDFGAGDADAEWIHAKLSTGSLPANWQSFGDLACFHELERHAVIAGMASDPDAGIADFIAAASGMASALRIAPSSVLRLALPPNGTPDCIGITAGPSDSESRALRSFDAAPLRVLRVFLQEVNVEATEPCTAYDFHYLENVDCHFVTVSRRQVGPTENQDYRYLLRLPLKLVTEPDANNAVAQRVKGSLAVLRRFLDPVFATQPATAELRFNFSDLGTSERISFDRPKGSRAVLIPDPYILDASLRKTGYPDLGFPAFNARFAVKKPVLFWRGSTTGSRGRQSVRIEDFITNPRVQACRVIQNLPNSRGDAKITQIVQLAPELIEQADHYLRQNNLVGAPVLESDFGRYQMYIDLPGNASAWGTFRKYLLGCLVLRPESEFELFYHRYLESGVHYLAVSDDLVDLSKTVAWVVNNPAAAARIAYAGRLRVIEVIDTMPWSVRTALQASATAGVSPIRAEVEAHDPPTTDLREMVRWAYLFLLGREPESAEVIDLQLRLSAGGDPEKLRQNIVSSAEFSQFASGSGRMG